VVKIINDERFRRDDLLALHTSMAHADAAERFPNFTVVLSAWEES
jgi:hypothetical protein